MAMNPSVSYGQERPPFIGRTRGELHSMVLLGWLWLASPFTVIALISHNRHLMRFVSAHHRRCLAAGWIGAALMLLGPTVIGGTVGLIMFLIGAPASGFGVWVHGNDGDDGGEQPPEVPPVDWGDFERAFWTHVRRRAKASPRPRAPSPG
jgi:hypothetical protein